MAEQPFDKDYYGLSARVAGVHFGYSATDKASAGKCLGRVMDVLLPGPGAIARVCLRCRGTSFNRGRRSDYSNEIVGRELMQAGERCPECNGRGGFEEERSDGMIVGFSKCGDCLGTCRVTERPAEDVVTRIGQLDGKTAG